jgi:CrcB protein
MGVLVEVLAQKFSSSLEVRTLFATGVLGGFTTFSAFSLDFAVLAGRHEYLQASIYLVASVALSIAAFYAGLWLMRTVLA